MTDVIHQSAAFERGKRREAREFQLACAFTFLIFLGPVIAGRLLHRQTDRSTEARRRSIFREAWEKANACIGISFMS